MRRQHLARAAQAAGRDVDMHSWFIDGRHAADSAAMMPE
jgi:hypothetical protein